MSKLTELKEVFLGILKELEKAEEVDQIKSCNEDKRLFTAVVLVPEEYDSQKHIYSEEVVEKACHDYNEHCRATDLEHLFIDTHKQITVVESWITPVALKIGETDVKKGSWVMTSRIDNDELWEECKKGSFTGWSVACKSLLVTEEPEE